MTTSNSNGGKSVLTFNVHSGAMYVIDPGFAWRWRKQKIGRVKNGTWQADIDVFRLDGDESDRISYLHIVHTDELSNGGYAPFDLKTSFPREGWEEAKFRVTTSYGTVGFFDALPYTKTLARRHGLLDKFLKLHSEQKAGIQDPRYEEVRREILLIDEQADLVCPPSGFGTNDFGTASKTAWSKDSSDSNKYHCFYRRNAAGKVVEAVVPYNYDKGEIDKPVLPFTVSSGAMCAIDPCYWECKNLLEPAKNGQWLASIGRFRSDKEPFLRVSYLHVIHTDEQVPDGQPPFGAEDAFPREGWELADFGVWVDSGQVSFIDRASLQDAAANELGYEDLEIQVAETGLHDFERFSGVEFGVVSGTAWGDGAYPCFFRRNSEGLIVEAVIDFITECGDEDEEDI